MKVVIFIKGVNTVK